MKDFRGKVAVITGGASGIGFATAEALGREGGKLVLADIEQGALDAAVGKLTAQGIEAIGVRTDVSDRAAVQSLADAAFAHFGIVHVLFNNAGVAVFGPTQDMSHADWQWSVNVNLWGPIHGVECFVARMVRELGARKEEGHVLFTASFAGLVANKDLGPYNVTKAGVVALAESLHKDLRGTGIGVSVLCPMRVTTNIDQSYRNRPAELGGAQANRTYTAEERATLNGATLTTAPVAELVLDAMRREALYIHTHRDAQQFFHRRAERIEGAFQHTVA